MVVCIQSIAFETLLTYCLLASILLTPFRSQNVPPPMSACQLTTTKPTASSNSCPSIPNHLSFSPKNDTAVLLWETGYTEVVDLQTRLGPGRGPVMNPRKVWSRNVTSDTIPRVFRQVVQWTKEDDDNDITRFAALGSADSEGFVSITDLQGSDMREEYYVKVPELNGRLLRANNTLSWQAHDGQIYDCEFRIVTILQHLLTGPIVTWEDKVFLPSVKLPEFCSDAECVELKSGGQLYVGLSKSSKLHVANTQTSRTLASNVNSFFVASGFLAFTTTAHVAQFAPLEEVDNFLKTSDCTSLPEWESRRVERGSRIVTAVPSTMGLVLQMPRGNLETIYPRPLVMKIVKQDFDQ